MTALAKLLAEKQQLIERLEKNLARRSARGN
jgi:hypothetical protein